MKLETTLTIGSRTERFDSSPLTLRTNVGVTLAMRKVSRDVRERFEQAVLDQKSSLGSFRFEDGDVLVEASALAAPAVHAAVAGEPPHINVRGKTLSHDVVIQAIMDLPLAPEVRSGVIELLHREGSKPGFHIGSSFSVALSQSTSTS